MTSTPVVRISRISFVTDMTRAGALVIPVARIVESVWPDVLRWVGLLARTRFTPQELDCVNMETWPEFMRGDSLASRLWDAAWQSPWGQSGEAVQSMWHRSALETAVEVLPVHGWLPDATEENPDVILAEADRMLFERIMAEVPRLAPTIAAPVIPLQPRKIHAQPTTARRETALAA